MTWTRHSPQLILVYDKDTLTALRVNGANAPLSVPLAVNPLVDEPHVVAQELRERLQPLGRLPRRVIVGVPMNRILVAAVPVPDMPDAEVPGFARLQAEREFLLPPEDLRLGVSITAADQGNRSAVLAALEVRQYANLERSLRLAGFREILVMPAAAAVASDGTAVRLVVAAEGVDLVACLGGVIVFLRRLAAGTGGPAQSEAALPALVSDVRISLRQLPEAVRSGATAVEVIGPVESVDDLVAALRQAQASGPWPLQAVPAEHSVASFLCAQTARRLAATREPDLVLAPVPVPPRQGGLARWRRPLVLAAAVAAAVALLGTAVIAYQSGELRTLRTEWEALSPRVTTVRKIIDSARSRQAWFSDQPVTLDLLRAITLAFPERGVVWATRIEITGRRQAVVAGNAVSREEWLKTLEALRQTPGVRDLRVTQARESSDGKAPMSFALSFTYAASGAERTDAGGVP